MTAYNPLRHVVRQHIYEHHPSLQMLDPKQPIVKRARRVTLPTGSCRGAPGFKCSRIGSECGDLAHTYCANHRCDALPRRLSARPRCLNTRSDVPVWPQSVGRTR